METIDIISLDLYVISLDAYGNHVPTGAYYACAMHQLRMREETRTNKVPPLDSKLSSKSFVLSCSGKLSVIDNRRAKFITGDKMLSTN